MRRDSESKDFHLLLEGGRSFGQIGAVFGPQIPSIERLRAENSPSFAGSSSSPPRERILGFWKVLQLLMATYPGSSGQDAL